MVDDETAVTDKDKEMAKLNKDLDRVTDYVEDREVYAEKLRQQITGILHTKSDVDAAKKQQEKELAAVTIKDEDVVALISEMDMDRASAERSLREHNGVLVDALRSLVQ